MEWKSRLTEQLGDDFHLTEIAARPAQFAAIPEWLNSNLEAALKNQGITQLWSHQVSALNEIHSGNNVIVSTGTASGKSMTYQLPIMSAIANAQQATPTAIYLAPTKALAHDQAESMIRWNIPNVRISTFDGDSTQDERRWAREHANVLVTNPDMVHNSLLPLHQRWDLFFRKLEFIAVDECHMYRGVFGSHVSNVLKRLLRVAYMYGARPTIVMASATLANPAAHAKMLTGYDFIEVTDSGAPRGNVSIALTLPPVIAGESELGSLVRLSTLSHVSNVLTELVSDDVRTMTFVQSRRAAEVVAARTQENLAERNPHLVSTISPYRAGFLSEERRAIEKKLHDGDLLGIATTNALELGIDIPALDAVIVTGWPGTRASFWQQVGRAGRDQQDAAAILVANDNPLDHYLVSHPSAIYDEPLEATVCDPTNENVLYGHLACAAAEQHLSEGELNTFGPRDKVTNLLEKLISDGYLRKRPLGWFWAGDGRASNLAQIRGNGEPPYSIVESDTGRLLGSIDSDAAFYQVHQGAIYTHIGETFIVDELDIENHVAFVSEFAAEYSTFARDITSTSIVSTSQELIFADYSIATGMVDVTEHVVSFQKRRIGTGQLMGEEELDLPARVLRTQGVWWTVSAERLKHLGVTDVIGAAHAAEHASIGLLPLFATCDRWDIGGVSIAEHPDTGLCTILVYDGHAGGAGFSERGFTVARDWLTATADAIDLCACELGCPSCIQSPKCGNGNHPLNKSQALALLRDLVHVL